jgi:hypothetical protein
MNRKQQRMMWLLPAMPFLAVLLSFSPAVAAQCPMCRTGLTQSAEGQRWARGINDGILFLLAAPFLIAGSMALVIWRSQVAAVLSGARARLEKSLPGDQEGRAGKPFVVSSTRNDP